MSEPIQAYPLAWPPGWRRTSAHLRTRARFAKESKGFRTVYRDGQPRQEYGSLGSKPVTIAEGTERTLRELERMGFNRSVIISTDLALRNDGLPRSNQREPSDPGVAVYWGTGSKRRCMAVDRYDRIADNLAAIAATLEAMRSIERHGGAEILDRAFTGFIALPAPEQPWQVLGLETSSPTREQVEDAHRRLAMKHHPDRGGDAHTMARINTARDELLGSTR